MKQNPFKNVGEIHKEWTAAGVSASRTTTHRRMQDMGFSCRIPCVKPLLNNRQCQKRLAWAKDKKDWTAAEWSKVMFSDESTFCISFGNQSLEEERRGTESRLLEVQCKVSTVSDGLGCHVICRSTVFSEVQGQHSRIPGSFRAFMPSNSPNINPIENLWGIVKRKMRYARPNNAEELKATIRATWALITPEQCHRLIDSMPRRIAAVIQAKGAATKY